MDFDNLLVWITIAVLTLQSGIFEHSAVSYNIVQKGLDHGYDRFYVEPIT